MGGTPAMSETIMGVTQVAENALVARIIVYDIAGASVLVTIFQKIWWQPREYCVDQACITILPRESVSRTLSTVISVDWIRK